MKVSDVCKLVCMTVLTCLSAAMSGQGVGINPTGNDPDPSSGLDVSFPDKGVLVSRMTSEQRDAISNPASGLLIYNTDCHTFNYNAGTPEAPVWAALWSSAGTMASVSLSASPSGPICYGSNVTFTASAVNGGTSPSYQWKVNGVNVGSNSPTFSTSSLQHDDLVTCLLTSNDPCVSGPPVTSDPIAQVVSYSPPAQPGSISGPVSVQRNSTSNVYSVSAVASATGYTWTVPDGATITSGQGTPAISVSFGPSSLIGQVTVVASNECGGGTAQSLTVNVGTAVFSATGTGRLGTMQTFTVNSSGIYTIEAFGAQGMGFFDITEGGRGARMKGDFYLTEGMVLDILVGQIPGVPGVIGEDPYTSVGTFCGGGGGSFVVSGGVPLIVAGGGGGGSSELNGLPGVTTTNGTDGQGGAQGTGGDLGGGGGGGSGYGGAGGGGFCGDGGEVGQDYNAGGSGGLGCVNGTDGQGSACTGTKGMSFLNGGAGGSMDCYTAPYNGNGGYGGGGAAVHGNWCAGGGGGYSGGGGGGISNGFGGNPGFMGPGGGGGSYNSGTNQSNSEGVQTGNGQVIISW